MQLPCQVPFVKPTLLPCGAEEMKFGWEISSPCRWSVGVCQTSIWLVMEKFQGRGEELGPRSTELLWQTSHVPFPPVQTLHFQGWRISDLPKPGSSSRCGAAPCPGTGPPQSMGDFGDRGSPPGLAHTQGRDTASLISGNVQRLCVLPGEEVANLAPRLPVPALKGHQDLPMGMPPLICQSLQWRNHVLTWAGTFQELENSVSALQWHYNYFLLFKSSILHDFYWIQ